jgi:hypothetical protein
LPTSRIQRSKSAKKAELSRVVVADFRPACSALVLDVLEDDD